MKLSEAILLGSTVVRCGERHDPKFEDRTAKVGCALDMACVAAGGRNWYETERYWPWTGERAPKEIVEFAQSVPEWKFVIAKLYDCRVLRDKTWTLDQLVSWVASVEPLEPIAIPSAEDLDAVCAELGL